MTQGDTDVNENDFGTNFQWFEWSFVSPEQDGDDSWPATQEPRGRTRENRVEVWDDDSRWTT